MLPLDRRSAPRALSLSLTVLLAACSSPGGQEPVVPANSAIVAIHATGAFTSHFEAGDRPAFARFVRATAQAASRADLTVAWRNTPELAAKGRDFLDRQVFEKAMQDGGWQAPAEAERNEGAFVQGTRTAATAFAEGRP